MTVLEATTSEPSPFLETLDLMEASIDQGCNNVDQSPTKKSSKGIHTGNKKKEGVTGKKQKAVPKNAATPTRGRRKSRWKLKFHHQALPPEYLKHYKQQEKKRRLLESNNKKIEADKLKFKKNAGKKDNEVALDSPLPVEAVLGTSPVSDHLNIEPQSPLESEEMKMNDRNLEDKLQHQVWPSPSFLGDNFPNLNIDLSHNKAFLENLLSNQIEINRVDRSEMIQPVKKPNKVKKPKPIPSSGRIMNYSDLPYMGEITLDGIKPRRGRKPKKADICHLIYKNYGQVFPGAPNQGISGTPPLKEPKWKPPSSRLPPPVPQRPQFQSESPLPTVSRLINHTEVQNRIINSLLERRLTQETRLRLEAQTRQSGNSSLEEPLNLCLKDLKSLKIKLSRKHGNIYETKSQDESPKLEMQNIKNEVIDVESDEESAAEDVDLTPFNLVTTELRDSSDDDSCMSLGRDVTLTKVSDKSSPSPQEMPQMPSPESTMYWPNNNFFYPSMPMLPEMYYQRLNSMKPPSTEKVVKQKTKSPARRLLPKGNPSSTQGVAKRKRSAIFIPPVPAENTSNPTTEVSICKFKFTGGAKPSLQEKKMLSVDSGGNFRYYSGTGDKSMRGYEYFPRESLQQCQENTGCSPSGVFLTASALGSGEKIPEHVGHSGFFDPSFPLQVSKPEAKKQRKMQPMEQRSPLSDQMTDSPDESTSSSPAPDLHMRDNIGREDEEDGRRAKKSKKSLAREKLEQTFKEKGFLIQTQQLESAEGATYCKFRQLRKFTRYLFRSWKDYLPGNVRDLSAEGGNGGHSITPPLVKDEVEEK